MFDDILIKLADQYPSCFTIKKKKTKMGGELEERLLR
jgi:hypothetical protein